VTRYRYRYGHPYGALSGGGWSSDLKVNLQAVWPFNGDALDATTNGYDMTLVNSPTYTTGKVNAQALQLQRASTQYASRTETDWDSNVEWTLASWFKVDSGANDAENHTIMSKYASGVNLTLLMIINNTSRALRVSIYDDTSVKSATRVGALSKNTWYLAFGGVSSTTGKVALNAEAATDVALAAAPHVSTAPIKMGAWSISSDLMDGIVGSSYVWSRWLPDAERSELYNSGAGKPYP